MTPMSEAPLCRPFAWENFARDPLQIVQQMQQMQQLGPLVSSPVHWSPKL